MEVSMLIHEAIEEYLGSKQNSIARKTYEWYALFLSKFDAWCKEQGLTDLTQITILHIQRFVASAPTTNTNTRHHRAQIVKGFMAWCSRDDEMGVREKMVTRIEMPKVEQPDVEIYTPAEISKIFRACEKAKHPLRNREIGRASCR